MRHLRVWAQLTNSGQAAIGVPGERKGPKRGLNYMAILNKADKT